MKHCPTCGHVMSEESKCYGFETHYHCANCGRYEYEIAPEPHSCQRTEYVVVEEGTEPALKAPKGATMQTQRDLIDQMLIQSLTGQLDKNNAILPDTQELVEMVAHYLTHDPDDSMMTEVLASAKQTLDNIERQIEKLTACIAWLRMGADTDYDGNKRDLLQTLLEIATDGSPIKPLEEMAEKYKDVLSMGLHKLDEMRRSDKLKEAIARIEANKKPMKGGLN